MVELKALPDRSLDMIYKNDYLKTQLQQFQFLDKYSRWDYEKGRRETWEESVERAVDFLRELSQNKLPEQDYVGIHNAILRMDVLPSMRLLAMAGDAARRCNSVLYNCSYVAIDSIDVLPEILYLSMSGVGVGFSVEKEAVGKLPTVKYQAYQDGSYPVEYIVEDSQVGWANALKFGLDMWLSGRDVVFDYSLIRPAGSVLVTKGGRASGHKPLENLLNYAHDTILNAQGRQLTPIEVHDIACMIGNCAVSGGSRRSALISLFDYDDDEMRHAKDYGWWKTHPQRANANNSIIIEEDLTRDQIEEIVMTMHNGGGGEPGFYFRKNAGKFAPRREFSTKPGSNPCQPGFAQVLTKQGETELSNVDIGDVIYSQDGWVTIVNKVSRGVKQVFAYGVDGYAVFVGTSDHKVLTQYDKRKIQIGYAEKNEIPIPVLNERTGELDYKVIDNCQVIGDYEVFSITVDGDSHTYWTGGVSACNCGEVDLNSEQFCNLSQAIVRIGDTPQSLCEKVEVASIIGTIQSVATDFEFLSDKWRENTEKDRLLGVDLTAQLDAPHLITSDLLDELRQVVINTNKRYAKILGIDESVATTVNKPSGNTSILADCAPGIHSRWSDYYIRRVRINANSAMRHVFEQSGFKLYPENGQQYETANTFVAEFPVKAPEGAITNGDRSAIQQCEWWKFNKTNWTEHNPSTTIMYEESELPELIDWICENQDIIGGMSFLQKDSHYYPLAPYESIDKETYDRMMSELPDIDFDLLAELEHEDYTTVAQEVGCAGGVCLI